MKNRDKRTDFITISRMEYYLTDHLGSIRTTIDQTGTVIGGACLERSREDDFDPFGNVLPGRSYNAGTPNDLNKFTGHERDQEGGLDLDYMLARNYDSELGRFYSVDPLHYKFPAWSPYNYTMNNPIIYIDPNGKELIIYYLNKEGEEVNWVFNGKNVKDAPKNEFVQKVIEVWNHAQDLDGFDNFKEAVSNEKKVLLSEGEFSRATLPNLHPQVKWNASEATSYEDGATISPATTLEHEMDHANSMNRDRFAHADRRNATRSDGYTNDEEYRVINGSEQKTAKAMKEIGPNGRTRNGHDVKYKKIKVKSPLRIN